MSVLPQQKASFTRLRDFGAFQVDVSSLDTQKVASIPTVVPVPSSPITSSSALSTQSFSPPSGVQERVSVTARTSKRRWFWFALRSACTLALFMVLLRSFSWETLLSTLVHIQPGLLLVGLVVGASGIVISCYQWRVLLRSERIHYDLADLIDLYVIGITLSHFLPTGIGGDAFKIFHVGRTAKNTAAATSTVVLCRVLGCCAMLMMALTALIFYYDYFVPQLIIWFSFCTLLTLVGLSGAVLVVALLPRLATSRWTRFRVIIAFIQVGRALIRSLRHPGTLTIALLFGLLFWGIAVLNCYAYAWTLNISLPLYFYFLVVPLISLISFLPVSINGFGLREMAFVSVFATMHVAPSVALLLALLLEAQGLFFALIGGMIYLMRGNSVALQRRMVQGTFRKPFHS